jgi:hypothetical protein
VSVSGSGRASALGSSGRRGSGSGRASALGSSGRRGSGGGRVWFGVGGSQCSTEGEQS